MLTTASGFGSFCPGFGFGFGPPMRTATRFRGGTYGRSTPPPRSMPGTCAVASTAMRPVRRVAAASTRLARLRARLARLAPIRSSLRSSRPDSLRRLRAPEAERLVFLLRGNPAPIGRRGLRLVVAERTSADDLEGEVLRHRG